MLRGFPVVVSAAPAPYSDAAGDDALNSPSVEGGHDGWWGTGMEWHGMEFLH